ncbi:MAG TPA: DMT family transporter [Bacillales bacterium]|nr:DMT family transporter [Bacillales bacterium]HEU5140793.1 DMT family transporter [Bacillales bacterium]
MSDKTKGILLLLLAAFGFSMMAAFVKLSGDLPAVQKTFFRNLVTMIIAFGFVISHKERLFGKKENQAPLLLRSACGTLGIILFFYAIDHLVLSDADMLNKLSPFLQILFAAVFLKEKARPFQLYSVLVAFIGALFIIQPSFSVETIPYAVGLLSAVVAAGAYTFLRVLGNREKYYTVVFYFCFFSTVVLLPFVILFYEPMTLRQFIYVLLTGIFATLGQFGITLAYKFAPAKDISIFFYSTVLYSTAISIVVFGQTPDPFSFVGYLIILGALFYMFIRNKKQSKST